MDDFDQWKKKQDAPRKEDNRFVDVMKNIGMLGADIAYEIKENVFDYIKYDLSFKKMKIFKFCFWIFVGWFIVSCMSQMARSEATSDQYEMAQLYIEQYPSLVGTLQEHMDDDMLSQFEYLELRGMYSDLVDDEMEIAEAEAKDEAAEQLRRSRTQLLEQLN